MKLFIKRINFLIIVLIYTSINNYILPKDLNKEEVPDDGNGEISVFRGNFVKHHQFYNWMWGEHYRRLYYLPVSAKTISLNTYHGGLVLDKEMKDIYGLLFRSLDTNQYYLLKPLNSSRSFDQSSFLRQMYSSKLYDDTYLGNFIKEAVTIENPYSFLLANNLANQINLDDSKVNLYHLVSENADTISHDFILKDELISLFELPNLDSYEIIIGADTMLQKIRKNKDVIDQSKYIRSRIFDMLIGDWNKIPENWGWISPITTDSISASVYTPIVLNRNHAFTKVDGVFFKRLVAMFGLSFITDYKAHIDNLSNFNKLGYPLDLALTAGSSENDWLKEVSFIQNTLTDSCIDSIFSNLPPQLHILVFDQLRSKLKSRRDMLQKVALDYYRKLQKTPIISGTDADESFFISNDSLNNLRIEIYNRNNTKKFDKTYSSKFTTEIWLYLFNGKNKVTIDKNKKTIPLTIIGGLEQNEYAVKNARGVHIYARKNENLNRDSLSHVKITAVDDSILNYDYQKYKYTEFSIMPIGIYDSDLGFNLGSFMSYTIYDFKRFPFTSQYQLGYNYSQGFTYQGIFPSYNPKKSFHILGFLNSPSYFYNFFGFGNETNSFSSMSKKYNRVYLNKYLITPAYYYTFDEYQKIHLDASFQSFKVKNPDGNSYINTVYDSSNPIFKTQNYLDLSLSYSWLKDINSSITNVTFDTQIGWNVNIKNLEQNYLYLNASMGFNLHLTNRLVLATELIGKVLFSDNYTFYQAVTTELRGFRQNRFIGRQSFYEYTDLRLDMGRLNNPFTPLNYGLFIGIDHGRVWYSGEYSKQWHVSYGGGFWLTVFKNITGKFSYFATTDEERFLFELGFSF